MSPKASTQHFIKRLNLISVGVILVAAGVLLRLFFLQVFEYDKYWSLAQSQQTYAAEVSPERGDIFMRYQDGSLLTLAATQKGFDLYLEPINIVDRDEVYAKLRQTTEIDEEKYYKIVSKTDDPYEVLKRHITKEEGDKIRSLGLEGVGLVVSSRRFYPAGPVASHAVGFVSTLSDSIEGKYGVEGYYEEALKGRSGSVDGERDGKGLWFIFGEQFSNPPLEGKNLVLTIEPKIQLFIENELDSLYEKWSYQSGGIIIIDPRTGAIKGMAARPNFNPNEYYLVDDLGTFLNPFTQKIFEMGSVVKPLTMAAAIDRGAVSEDTTYIDRGSVSFGPDKISNFDGEARGKSTMLDVLKQSLNTGAVFAMQQLGGVKLKEYFYKYGLGEKLGIDLPGELAGNLRNLDSGREIEFATASFGQGVAVTPLELTMALGTLANEGVLMRPYIAEHQGPNELRQVLDKSTAMRVSRMLTEVVDTTLADGKVKFNEYSVAAKTGTAQIADRSGGYSQEYFHSFFGYFPSYDPEFLVFMFVEKPKGVRYASQTLSMPFRDIVEFLINYYTIPPDRPNTL